MTAGARPRPFAPRASRPAALRALLRTKQFFIAPGAYDCITARLVEVSGFPAAYVTGSGLSLSTLGAPDVGLVSYARSASASPRWPMSLRCRSSPTSTPATAAR